MNLKDWGKMNELALFAGVGGGILGGHLLGWRTVCAVEYESYPAGVLCARQNDGTLAPFPIWDDVRTFDGRPWRGIVDVVSGGFPCQDISVAGRGAGLDGERSGLWREMARIIGEVRPRFAFVENSPMLIHRGLATVISDLAEMGYDAQWCVVSASDVGAPHRRDRIWILATDTKQCELLAHTNHGRIGRWEQQSPSVKKTTHTNSDQVGRRERCYAKLASGAPIWSQSYLFISPIRPRQPNKFPNTYGMWQQQSKRFEQNQRGWARYVCQKVSNTASIRPQGQRQFIRPLRAKTYRFGQANITQPKRQHRVWATEPNVGRVAYGVAARMDRLKAIGNGQVSLVAAVAWRVLTGAYDADEYV